MSAPGRNTEQETTYRVIYDILRSRIVVYIHGDAPQGRDLGRQLREARVVLALPLVGVRHVAGAGRYLSTRKKCSAPVDAWSSGWRRCVDEGARILKIKGHQEVQRSWIAGSGWRTRMGRGHSLLVAALGKVDRKKGFGIWIGSEEDLAVMEAKRRR